jgi:crossover junction endodeoxyribonuclease RuvC
VFDPMGPVLGIDPGVSRCGYGAVRTSGGAVSPVACGVIRTEPAEPLPERLAALQRELEVLVADLRPAAMAVERVLFQANVRTAMSVGQASGLALAVAARARVPVAHYSPNEVKLAVAGYGGAGKAQVQEMVSRVLRLETPPSPADAADALALAVCHLWGAPLRAAVGEHSSGTAPGLARAVAAAVHKVDKDKDKEAR